MKAINSFDILPSRCSKCCSGKVKTEKFEDSPVKNAKLMRKHEELSNQKDSGPSSSKTALLKDEKKKRKWVFLNKNLLHAYLIWYFQILEYLWQHPRLIKKLLNLIRTLLVDLESIQSKRPPHGHHWSNSFQCPSRMTRGKATITKNSTFLVKKQKQQLEIKNLSIVCHRISIVITIILCL